MDANETALLEQARAAWDAERWEEAAARYEELLGLCPDAPESYAWWFDAALAFKFLRNWPKAFELGREAAARSEHGKGDPAFWNLGIAATILGEWAVARQAWTDYGITLPPGDGEIDGDFGTACVRLSGQRPEVVWVRRICPTRARVVSIPFGERRYGEVVVHDGAPNGERIVDGRRYPVFDELLLSKPSTFTTFRASVSCNASTDLEALGDAVEEAGLAIESLSSMVIHPREESEGRVEMTPSPAEAGEHGVLLAAPDATAAQAVLERWAANGDGRGWRDLREKHGSLQPGGTAACPRSRWCSPGRAAPELAVRQRHVSVEPWRRRPPQSSDGRRDAETRHPRPGRLVAGARRGEPRRTRTRRRGLHDVLG